MLFRSVSRKSRRLFGPEKPVAKLRPAPYVKLIFSFVVKVIKIKITAKFHVTNTFVLKMQREFCHPKRFGTFEKRALGPFSRFAHAEGYRRICRRVLSSKTYIRLDAVKVETVEKGPRSKITSFKSRAYFSYKT